MRLSLRGVVVAVLLALPALGGTPRPAAPVAEEAPKLPRIGLRTTTAHFDVEYTVPQAIGKGYAAVCERTYERFCEIFEVPKSEAVWDGRCRVYLFANREQFMRFATIESGREMALSGGYTRPTKENPVVVMPMYGQDRVRLEQVLIHELAHVFLELFRKDVELPIWLHEGVAQLFEFMHNTGDWRIRLWKATVKELVRSGRAAPLSDFWVAAFPATDVPGYAQSWSLVHYLTQNPRTKRNVGKFVIKLKEVAPEHGSYLQMAPGRGSTKLTPEAARRMFELQAAAFKDVFGGSVADFERAWKQFVLATY